MNWSAGDHFSIAAPTGEGKTHFTKHLIRLWDWVLTIDVKDDDILLRSGAFGRRITRYPTQTQLIRAQASRSRHHHFRLVAPAGGATSRSVILDAWDRAWKAGRPPERGGSWLLNLDEVRLISDKMKLRDQLETLLIAARSRGITILGGTQAPREVVTEFWDQPRWYALGAISDKRSRARLGEIGGPTDLIMATLPTLETHEFLILGPDHYAAVTKAPK